MASFSIYSYFVFLLLNISPTPQEKLSPARAIEDARPVVLTVFPPPEAPRELNTNVVGLELAFSANPEIAKKFQLVHLSIKNELHELAVKTLEAVQKYKPILIVGGSTSNAAFVISDIAETHQIPFITPWATHPRLTEKKAYTFRVCFDDNYQAVKLADFAFKEKGAKRAVILSNRRETFSIGVSEIFAKRFLSLKGAIVGRVDFSDEKEIDEARISEIASWNPDLIFIPSYELETAAILSRLVPRLSSKAIYLGADAWSGSRMIQGVLEGLQLNPLAYYVEHWSPDFKSKGNAEFMRLYRGQKLSYLKNLSVEEWIRRESNSGATSSGVALGYDAGLVLIAAIRNRQSGASNWADAIRAVDLEGATGYFRFRNAPTPEKGLFIYSFEDRSMKFVKAYR